MNEAHLLWTVVTYTAIGATAISPTVVGACIAYDLRRAKSADRSWRSLAPYLLGVLRGRYKWRAIGLGMVKFVLLAVGLMAAVTTFAIGVWEVFTAI